MDWTVDFSLRTPTVFVTAYRQKTCTTTWLSFWNISIPANIPKTTRCILRWTQKYWVNLKTNVTAWPLWSSWGFVPRCTHCCHQGDILKWLQKALKNLTFRKTWPTKCFYTLYKIRRAPPLDLWTSGHETKQYRLNKLIKSAFLPMVTNDTSWWMASRRWHMVIKTFYKLMFCWIVWIV